VVQEKDKETTVHPTRKTVWSFPGTVDIVE
jgi:hypothetical protein